MLRRGGRAARAAVPQAPARRRFLAAALAASVAGRARTGEASLLRRAIAGGGESLPVVGLGTWLSFDVEAASDLAEARDSLRALVDGGGSVVDSSPMYGGAESVVGGIVADIDARGRVFLATKVWTEGREAGIRQMEESLQRLRTGRLDLMQIHNLVDARTHVRTLRAWKDAGRIRFWGLTHYHEGAHGEMEGLMRAERPDFIQINYSMAEPEAGRRLLPLAAQMGVAVIANRPFAEGALFRRVTGRPLPAWAGELGAATWAQFFLKWIIGDPAVTCVIPATRRAAHMAENLAAGTHPVPAAVDRSRMERFLRES